MEVITDLKHILHSKRANIYYQEAYLRVENLLWKSWIWLYFPTIIVKYTYILLKFLKNLPQTNFPSLRFLFLDKLRHCRVLQKGGRVVYYVKINGYSLLLQVINNKEVEFDLFKNLKNDQSNKFIESLELNFQGIKIIKEEVRI